MTALLSSACTCVSFELCLCSPVFEVCLSLFSNSPTSYRSRELEFHRTAATTAGETAGETRGAGRSAGGTAAERASSNCGELGLGCRAL